MYKLQQKEKQTEQTRHSTECLNCLDNKKCNSKYGLSVFEKNMNMEVDCWARKIYPNLFFTGLHKPMFLQSKSPYTGNVIPIHKWVHIMDEKFDVESEKFLNN